MREALRVAGVLATQRPGYRRTAVHWVTQAKREEAREQRLAQLNADCAANRRIGALTSPTRRG